MSDANGAEGKATAGTEGSDEFGAAWDEFRDDDLKEAGQPSDGADSPEPDAAKTGAGQDDKSPLSSEAASQAPAPAENPNDVWANAPPELREAHLREVEKRDALIRSHNGRLSRADHELQALRARLDTAAGVKAADNGQARGEKLNKLREEYSEIAEPMLEEIEALKAEMNDLKGAKVSLDQERTAANLLEQEQLLTDRHPDWKTEASDDRFRQWALAQEPFIQEAIERNGQQIVNGAETARILSLYKAETQQAQPTPTQERHNAKRAEQLEASRSTPVKAPSVSSGGGASDFDGAWDEFREKDRRRSAGRRS